LTAEARRLALLCRIGCDGKILHREGPREAGLGLTMWWHGHGSWWGWLVMSLVLVASLVLIIWAVLSLLPGGANTERRSPERILAERFAKGEINEEEYRRRLEALRSTRHGDADP
jgi:putative membrane protein